MYSPVLPSNIKPRPCYHMAAWTNTTQEDVADLQLTGKAECEQQSANCPGVRLPRVAHLCLPVYTCVYLCMLVYTCVYLCILLYTCVYMCKCSQPILLRVVHLCVCVCVCVCVCAYLWILVYCEPSLGLPPPFALTPAANKATYMGSAIYQTIE